MRSVVYALAALAAPVAVLGQLTTIYLPAGLVSTPRTVEISAPDAHHVLSHHLGVDNRVLDAPAPDHPDLWHHLPADTAEYDASALFRPGGAVVLTFNSGADERDLFGESLQATHTVPHRSDEDFDSLASLYGESRDGVVHNCASKSNEALDRLRAEVDQLEKYAADETLLALSRLNRMRFDALQKVRKEFGAASDVYKQAKEQLRAALEQFVQKKMDAAFPLVVVNTASEDERTLERRSTDGQPNLAAFTTRAIGIGGPMRRPNGTLPNAGACHVSAQSLESATGKCSGHGVPIETSKGGQKCWRCQCTPTKTKQRTFYWTGSACEKQDKSDLTLLIIGTVSLLFVSAVGTVALLYNEGKVPLPGTLSSVSLSS
ncbi:hypothetical protein CBS9595_001674 [Malassezia furfur]|nr:hypothetical protein CBS9595_001674 [Malassezia furfur]